MNDREMAAEIEIGYCGPPDGGKFGLPQSLCHLSAWLSDRGVQL